MKEHEQVFAEADNNQGRERIKLAKIRALQWINENKSEDFALLHDSLLFAIKDYKTGHYLVVIFLKKEESGEEIIVLDIDLDNNSCVVVPPAIEENLNEKSRN